MANAQSLSAVLSDVYRRISRLNGRRHQGVAIIIMYKALKRESLRILHPQAVKLIKLYKLPLPKDVIHGTGTYMVVFLELLPYRFFTYQ